MDTLIPYWLSTIQYHDVYLKLTEVGGPHGPRDFLMLPVPLDGGPSPASLGVRHLQSAQIKKGPSDTVYLTSQVPEERTSIIADKENPYLFDTIGFLHKNLEIQNFPRRKYVKNGRSIAQIATETLSSRDAVRRALIEFENPLKKRGKPGLRPAQVPYGFRRSDGLLVPHLCEQRVIQSVKKMSEDGLSYRKICDLLTNVGVPTKKQGKGWQPEMIRRLLNRKNNF